MQAIRLFLIAACMTACVAQAGEEQTAELTPAVLDALIVDSSEKTTQQMVVEDEVFLRRVSLDLIGRQPTPQEMESFVNDSSADKRQEAIDRLLAAPEYGLHWANYWRDTIAFRVPPPELTFLDYRAFQSWLSEQLAANESWDEITRAILTATGPVKENPAGTFVGYHQGNAVKLGAETARIFLGMQLQCAECHDHPYDEWKREQFHQLAAFFARTKGELGKIQDGSGTVVSDRGKGEYTMPNAIDPTKKGTPMSPSLMTGETLPLGKPDMARRQRLANLITLPDNPWFARAYVNRIWGRLMGRGFYEPVDDMGDSRKQLLPEAHRALADHFVATNYDIKALFRLIVSTNAYQRQLSKTGDDEQRASGTVAQRLRGDVVFDSLVAATGLPNVTPEQVPATDEFRFPPPPKSTRTLVVDVFKADPSLPENEQPRTMGQAMLLMNNKQLQAQINADPSSETQLSRLLTANPDDGKAIGLLYLQVLSRDPTRRETEICLRHIEQVGERGPAFEDLLWGLINSAEFITKK